MTVLLKQPSRLYTFSRELLRKIPFLDSVLMRFIRNRRLARAATILKDCNQFPEDRDNILKDFKYAITFTDRNICQATNLEAILRYVETEKIEGAFVETGTYTGGASAYALRALLRIRKQSHPRPYWGFDSFEGMPTPSLEDGDQASFWVRGRPISDLQATEIGSLIGHKVNKADYETCLNFLYGTGYPKQHIHLVKGWFQETLRLHKNDIGVIAVLRLDGDFYDSTKVVFSELYDQVADNGVIIIDDYGVFQGCRQATDEFFTSRSIQPHLIYVENGIRYFVKPSAK